MGNRKLQFILMFMIFTVRLSDALELSVNYTFDNLNTSIPDNGELLLQETLDTGFSVINNITTSVEIEGTGSGGFNGDFFVSLSHGSNYAVLVNRPGKTSSDPFGYYDDGINVTFDDSATNGDIHNYRQTLFGNETTPTSGALTGTWAPDGRAVNSAAVVNTDSRTALLSSFTTWDSTSSWKLFIADDLRTGTSQVKSWSLHITVTPQNGETLTLSGGEFEATPTSGNITNDLSIDGDLTFANATKSITFQGTNTLTGDRTLTVENSIHIENGFGESGGSQSLVKEGSGTLILTGSNTYSGTTTVNNGTLQLGEDGVTGTTTVASDIAVNSGAGLNVDANSTITVSGDATLQGNDTNIGANSQITFDGTTTGAGNFTGDGKVTFSGTYQPGNSPAIITSYVEVELDSTNILEMELGGLTAGTEHDRFDVINTLTVAGSLNIILINGFVPADGNMFDILNWNMLYGSFETINLPNVDSGLAWNSSSLLTTGTLSVEVIPETKSMVLITGLLVLGCVLLRKRG